MTRAAVGAPVLGDVTDAEADTRGIGAEVAAGDGSGSGGRVEEGGEHPQGGGFPGAVRAKKSNDLAGREGEVYAAYCLDGAAAGAKGFGEAAGFDHGRSLYLENGV
jgi:hypothetical protein